MIKEEMGKRGGGQSNRVRKSFSRVSICLSLLEDDFVSTYHQREKTRKRFFPLLHVWKGKRE